MKVTIEIGETTKEFRLVGTLDQATKMALAKRESCPRDDEHQNPMGHYGPNFKPIILYGFSVCVHDVIMQVFCEPILITPNQQQAINKQYGAFGTIYCLYR